MPADDRIFILIPSYRDPECHPTINDLFAKAAHPERLFVGVCWQYDKAADGQYLTVPLTHPGQVRTVHFPLEACKGAGWARNEALKLMNGEPYVLQIQAHMCFEQGWDDTLIDMLSRCPSAKPVLAFWPPDFNPTNGQCTRRVQRTRVNAMGRKDDAQFVHLTSDYLEQGDPRTGLYSTPLWIGCFMFARAEVFQHVKADPHIFFWGEEIVYSARLWTHGYDLFQNDRPVVYHQWFRESTKDKQGYRAMQHPGNRKTYKRARHLLGVELSEDADALAEIDLYGHGTARSLDTFFTFAGIDLEKRTATEDARKGIWNMPEEEQQAAGLPRIFVQIAAYRDPECQHTVKELFAHAAHPERISVGICWQFNKDEDQHCFTVPYPRPEQVRVIEVDARESKGVCWARSKVQELWQGEEYTLQIDSHMRFEQGWDESLIQMLRACPSPKSVLTTYPAGYTPPRDIQHRITYRLVAKEFDSEGIFTMNSRPIAAAPPPAAPLPGAFAGACMLFGPSSIIQDVPYDPLIYFFGEEITLSARLWTHGYDIYHPNRVVMYHFWERKSRRTHFDDHRQWPKQNRLSFARVKHILGTQISTDPEVLKGIDHFGLGSARSLQQYQQFCGVDFARRSISPAAYEGRFPAGLAMGAKPAMPQNAKPRPNGNGNAQPHAVRNARPRKVMETQDIIVYDDFLPQDVYGRLFDFVSQTDYQYINTQGKVKRVWDMGNGFPLRSEKNVFYYAEGTNKPQANWVYPSKTPFDRFVEHTNGIVPEAQHLVGAPGQWEHFSVTSWIYPPGTGLSMHDDGSGIYTGAYVFFMNNEWKLHWGGLLIVLDHESNVAIQNRKKEVNAYKYHMQKWLHLTDHEDIALENGLAQCILPKANRMVFIHPDAFHMVTQVLPTAGDRVRMSLAGFFHKAKQDQKKEAVESY